MARTLTLPKKGTGLWNEGWHELTISKATYGEWNDSKYIDVWFDGYPDNFNMRVYSKVGKSGEEFAIGNLFKTVNVYFYKSGKFTRILNQVAPMPFTNIVEEFNDKDVKYFKGRAEKYFKDYIQPKLEDTVEEETVTNDMPY